MNEHDPIKLKKESQSLLAEYQSRDLSPKERRDIPVQEMPSQDPLERAQNMTEVALGYFEEQAKVEAFRCLQCKNPLCVKGCPVGIDIPGFIKEVAEGNFRKAADVIEKYSLLPAVCGRVCPQETQCQAECVVGRFYKDPLQAVAIGRLERFIADWARNNSESGKTPEVKADTGKKVGIIGSGPAGITVAADVRRAGHSVTIFEAFHKPGGVLMYGIPEFRLPKDIVQQEISKVVDMGVEVRTNFIVGRTRTIPQLMEDDGFDALFVGSGAGLPKFMKIEGENLVGVFSANEYLTRVNLMRAYDKERVDTPIYNSRKVAVLGGGNVAMDAARSALRMGAEEVHLIYRRTEKEMPARVEEVVHAREEGVQFHLLQNVIRIVGDDNDQVTAVDCVRYELGEPDDSGRRRPVQVEGSEFQMEMDTVIVAIGNNSNPLITQTTPGLDSTKWGTLIVDENQKTSIEGVYAGGDIVLGAATVILAMGEGRKAAAAINEYLDK